ncbi:cupin domain-containing protein [Roseibium salinum]|nr:cupin domain-containing protein [Roseibium salinum]
MALSKGERMQNRADLISDVLRVVQLSGAIFFEVNARAPWISEAPRSSELLPLVMPEAQGLIEYHVMLQGEGWAEIVSEAGACERVRLEAGSVIIFPHGDAHRMGSDLALEVRRISAISRPLIRRSRCLSNLRLGKVPAIRKAHVPN